MDHYEVEHTPINNGESDGSEKRLPLRFDEAADVLTVEEAASILRRSANSLYERIKQDRHARESGRTPANAVPILPNGRLYVIPADLLIEWIHREVEQ